MSLRAYCGKRVVTISPERSVAEDCWVMKDKNIGCLLVENHGKLCGILTDRDIVLKVTGEDKEPLTTMVEEVMTRDPARISVNQNILHLVSLMHAQHVRRVPIVDGSDTILGEWLPWMISSHSSVMNCPSLGKPFRRLFPEKA